MKKRKTCGASFQPLQLIMAFGVGEEEVEREGGGREGGEEVLNCMTAITRFGFFFCFPFFFRKRERELLFIPPPPSLSLIPSSFACASLYPVRWREEEVGREGKAKHGVDHASTYTKTKRCNSNRTKKWGGRERRRGKWTNARRTRWKREEREGERGKREKEPYVAQLWTPDTVATPSFAFNNNNKHFYLF